MGIEGLRRISERGAGRERGWPLPDRWGIRVAIVHGGRDSGVGTTTRTRLGVVRLMTSECMATGNSRSQQETARAYTAGGGGRAEDVAGAVR